MFKGLLRKKFSVIGFVWSDKCWIENNILFGMKLKKYAEILEYDEAKSRYSIRRFLDGKIEYLQYNEISDNWWCYDSRNLQHVRSLSYPEFKEKTSVVIVCNKYKYINFSVAKNCNSTILLNAMNFDQGLDLKEGDIPWYGSQKEKTLKNALDYRIYDSDVKKYSDYRKFIVYRDPIDRFVNVANYTFIGRDESIGAPFLNHKLDKTKYIDELLKISEIYNNNVCKYIGDQHLLSQARILARITPDSVDDMVMIKDFTKYAQKELGIDSLVWANKSAQHLITADDLSEAQREKIKDLYSADYDLYKAYEHKLYVP